MLFVVCLSFSLRICIIQGKRKAAFFPPTLFWKIIFGGCWRELGPRRHLPKQQGLCAFTQQYCTRKTPSDLLLRDTCEIYIGFFLMAASRIWKFYLRTKRIWKATCIQEICKQDSNSCLRAHRLPHLPAFFLPLSFFKNFFPLSALSSLSLSFSICLFFFFPSLLFFPVLHLDCIFTKQSGTLRTNWRQSCREKLYGIICFYGELGICEWVSCSRY